MNKYLGILLLLIIFYSDTQNTFILYYLHH